MSTRNTTMRQTQAATPSATQIPAIKRIFLVTVMLVLSIVSDFGGDPQGFTWFHRLHAVAAAVSAATPNSAEISVNGANGMRDIEHVAIGNRAGRRKRS